MAHDPRSKTPRSKTPRSKTPRSKTPGTNAPGTNAPGTGDPAPRSSSSAAGQRTSSDRIPTDLGLQEQQVADWMAALPRVDAPATLRGRVLAGAEWQAAPALSGRSRGRLHLLHSWRALAAAAAVLLAVGAGIALRPSGESAPDAPEGPALALQVVPDQGLAPLHGLETFDHVGFEPGELIADWGR